MRVGIIFTFDATHKKPSEKRKFYWKLYGRSHSSNFGKYIYEEKGLLSDITYLSPSASVVIVNAEHAKLLSEFFKNERARFSKHKIILTEKEFRNLS